MVLFFSWIDYFAKFSTIKKFSTYPFTKIDVDILQSLAVKLPHLMELSFYPDENLTKRHLIEFFKKNKRLEIIILIVRQDFSDELFNEMKDEFAVKDDRYTDMEGSIEIKLKVVN